MPTLHMSIERTGAKNTLTEQKWTIQELQSFSLTSSEEFDYDRIEADVRVSLDPEPSSGPIVCDIDPNKKLVTFKTHRQEQELDLFLRPEGTLKGRVHFRRVEVANDGDVPKFARVEYLVQDPRNPSLNVVKSVKFGDDIPAQVEQIRLVFRMKGKTLPYAYKIFVRDLQGSISGEECDPQASNEPPQVAGMIGP